VANLSCHPLPADGLINQAEPIGDAKGSGGVAGIEFAVDVAHVGVYRGAADLEMLGVLCFFCGGAEVKGGYGGKMSLKHVL